jgi:hypothetical protein
MQQPVENRGGQDLVAEDGAPLRHELIGGDQQAAAPIAAGDQLKEEVGAPPFKRQVAELVDDEELRLAAKQQAVGRLPFGLRFGQGGQQRRGAGEEDRVAGFDDGTAQGDRDVESL